MGADIKTDGNIVKINSFTVKKRAYIDCNESGSTLRFLVSVAAALGISAAFNGKGKLPERPLDEFFRLYNDSGIILKKETNKKRFLSMQGECKSNEFILSGDVSSQYLSGLLMASPLYNRDINISLSTPLSSGSYVDITLDVMHDFGIDAINRGSSYYIRGGQKYKPRDYKTEGDFSSAAFWYATKALGCDVEIQGLSPQTTKQGDRAIIEIVQKYSNANKNIVIDCDNIPDLIPIIAVIAALSDGYKTIVKNCGRLRYKESNRLAAIFENLKTLNADIKIQGDDLIINGKSSLNGGEVEGYNDHRIVMSMAIAAIKCKDAVKINGFTAINKSYPRFFEDYRKLGGKINVSNMG